MNKQRIWNHPKGVVVACDGTKLRDILYGKGYSLIKASKELKVGNGTFSRVYQLNCISSTVVALLEQFMDISPSDYDVHVVEGLSWGEWNPMKKNMSRCPSKNYNRKPKPIEDIDICPTTPIVEQSKEPVKAKVDDTISITFDIDCDVLKALIKEAVKEAFNEI